MGDSGERAALAAIALPCEAEARTDVPAAEMQVGKPSFHTGGLRSEKESGKEGTSGNKGKASKKAKRRGRPRVGRRRKLKHVKQRGPARMELMRDSMEEPPQHPFDCVARQRSDRKVAGVSEDQKGGQWTKNKGDRQELRSLEEVNRAAREELQALGISVDER